MKKFTSIVFIIYLIERKHQFITPRESLLQQLQLTMSHGSPPLFPLGYRFKQYLPGLYCHAPSIARALQGETLHELLTCEEPLRQERDIAHTPNSVMLLQSLSSTASPSTNPIDELFSN